MNKFEVTHHKLLNMSREVEFTIKKEKPVLYIGETKKKKKDDKTLKKGILGLKSPLGVGNSLIFSCNYHSRRCNGKGVVESDCGNEGSSGKGGGRDFMRSAGSSRQRLRMRQRRHEKRWGGTKVVNDNGRKGNVSVLGRGGYSKGKKGQRRRTATTSVRVLAAIEEEERGWPAVGVGASEEGVATAGKSGRWQPIDGERWATARMVGDDEGGRQQRRLGMAVDSDKGLACG
ncbi:hypothetical protein B296_00026149 [Ensete ventricosum]|uniref:Uncharacterized protein n=1 Tax=Ensete ventricosum TaxID=4639 RepID=A0A426YPZ5_ENSVE|nr:hypothetical protein B296_00026149 [Ensete ventricosum]